MLQQSAMSPSQLNNILGSLLGCCSDENATTVSWALIAIASCAYQAASADNSLHARWTSLWQLACRFMTSASNCRAACAVLCIMVRGQLAQTALVSELYQTLAVAFELSGPNILCDT